MPPRGRHSSLLRPQAVKVLQDIMTASWLCEAYGGRKSALLFVCVPDVFFANFWPRYATKRPRYLSQHVFSAVIGAAALCSNVQRQGKPGVSSFCPCMVCPYRMRGYSILHCEVYNDPSRSEVYVGYLVHNIVHISSSRMPLIVESFSPGGANI